MTGDREIETPQPIEIEARWSRASYAAGEDRPAVLEVGITARRAEGEAAAKVPAEIALVLDVSGSMNAPERYPLVEQAVEKFLSSLDPADRAAIFAFSESGVKIAGLTEGRRLAERWPELAADLRRAAVFFGGSTRLSTGMLPAVAELRLGSRPGAVRRIYVLTDGALHDLAVCEALALDLAKNRVELQIHGFGRGFEPEQLSSLVRGVPGGTVKPLVDTRRVLDVFRHLADTSGRIALSDVKVDVRFAPGVLAGDAFALAPSRRWLGTVAGGAFSDELFSMEIDRRYAWIFELRLPEAGVGSAAAALISVLGEQGAAARHASLEVAVARTDADGAPEPEVERAHALVVAERDDDLETRVGALEARLSLCRDEGRDPALIAALERKLAALTGGDERGAGGVRTLPSPCADDELYVRCAESSVQVFLPELAQRAAALAGQPATAPDDASTGTRILIAGADEPSRRVLELEARAALAPAEPVFEFAGSADEILAAAKTGEIDLLIVLLDNVRTSRFHGRDRRIARVVEAATELKKRTGAAVIALANSGAGVTDPVRLAADTGFDAAAFLPWDGDWLHEAVRRAAAGNRKVT